MKKIFELLRHYLAYLLPQKVEDINFNLMIAILFGINFVLLPILEYQEQKSIIKYKDEIMEVKAEAIILHYVGEGHHKLEVIEKNTGKRFFDGFGGVGERLFRFVKYNNDFITSPNLIVNFKPNSFDTKKNSYYGRIDEIIKEGTVIYKQEKYPLSHKLFDIIIIDGFNYLMFIIYYLYLFALLAQIKFLKQKEGSYAVMSAIFIYFSSLLVLYVVFMPTK